MPTAPATQALTLKAPAKLNLYLEVLGRRDDGYHEIVTVMQAITLFDELTFENQPRDLSLVCDSDEVPCDESNLVLKAARTVRNHAGVGAGARITLVKRIPVGAGMGGGSSDAAATIKGLNALWGLDLPDADQHAIAAGLGSDVNFFLLGGTALCRGRGERVEPIADPPRRDYVVVYPNVHLSTKAVYEKLRAALTTSVQHNKLFLSGGLCTDPLAHHACFNRLEEAAFGLCERLPSLKEAMQAEGLQSVTMTGSGSALYGIARNMEEAEAISQRLSRRSCGRVFVAQSLT